MSGQLNSTIMVIIFDSLLLGRSHFDSLQKIWIQQPPKKIPTFVGMITFNLAETERFELSIRF